MNTSRWSIADLLGWKVSTEEAGEVVMSLLSERRSPQELFDIIRGGWILTPREIRIVHAHPDATEGVRVALAVTSCALGGIARREIEQGDYYTAQDLAVLRGLDFLWPWESADLVSMWGEEYLRVAPERKEILLALLKDAREDVSNDQGRNNETSEALTRRILTIAQAV